MILAGMTSLSKVGKFSSIRIFKSSGRVKAWSFTNISIIMCIKMNRLLDGSGYAGIGMSLINWLISSTLLAVSANIVLTLFFRHSPGISP